MSTDVIVEPAWPNTANILEPEAGGGHPLAVGLLPTQHGQGGDVNTAIAPEGLGLDITSAHASSLGKGAAEAGASASVFFRFPHKTAKSQENFPLYLKELEFRYNNRDRDLFELVAKYLCDLVPKLE